MSNIGSRFGKSSNPFLTQAMSKSASHTTLDGSVTYSYGDTMTASGAVNKTFMLFGILLVTAAINWNLQNTILTYGGLIVGLIAVIASRFRMQNINILAPIYAAAEGLFLGGISSVINFAFTGPKSAMIGGIVFQAITITLSLMFFMLFFYRSGIIKVTDKLRSGIMVATAAVMFLYLANLLLGLFGVNIPFLHSGGTIGIIVSLVIIGIATMNLLLDFDFIDQGAAQGLPKNMEWFAGMSLMITLVWIYVEVLRLLMVLAGSRD